MIAVGYAGFSRYIDEPRPYGTDRLETILAGQDTRYEVAKWKLAVIAWT